MIDKNKIMILCKVVDNYGDIGVVYRLARALSDLRPELELTLVVSNLESFHRMAREIYPEEKIQDFKYKNTTWKILDWNLDKEVKEPGKNIQTGKEISLPNSISFDSQIILECFQCGRPDWLEDRLFSESFTETVQIINIDYLTAEDYADEFHLLKSGTRKANIKKIFFMPGFTDKTGGLIQNETVPIKKSNTASLLKRKDFNIFFFAYEDDCTAIVKGITDFQNKIRESNPAFTVKVFAAEGKSAAPFLSACHKNEAPFEIETVPFMMQEDFDAFILTMDFLFVRGEDSLARACLSALPFIWQAYKQDENYQLVKVNALLDRMAEFFEEKDFESLKAFFQSYNDYERETESASLTQVLLSSAEGTNLNGFKSFAKKLYQNGNLALHLLNYIDTLKL